MNCECERQRLLNLVRMYDFAITDVTLYLDSHPKCPHGLAYYYKYKQLYSEALAAYERQFGPMTNRANTNPTTWTWVDDPWPWELEA
ncbi:MAG: spore coat protein CotJB [Anaerotruncus sp.]|jgi:spore coat protein JB|nr:spore coat protein CotJB [Anaerotruncus sp.]